MAPAAHPGPGFEVMYLLGDCAPENIERLRARLAELGDSVAIAASGFAEGAGPGHYSVHVHADDAGAAVEAGLDAGHREPHPDHLAGRRRRPARRR